MVPNNGSKVKILAISDQHGYLPDIPECDLLLVAGDLCPDRINQERWFKEKWIPWILAQPIKQCFATWGNHDYYGERLLNEDIDTYGVQKDNKTIRIVTDQLLEVDGLRVYLTPWSNTFGNWAFMQQPEELKTVYEKIPIGLDVLVSHQPPIGYGSDCYYLNPNTGAWTREEVGSKELLDVIVDRKPKAVVCGHIHSGYGTYDCDGIKIYNVAVVNEEYQLVNKPTEIVL